MEESVYFNIRDERSVIKVSLKGGECNLLNKKKIDFFFKENKDR